MRVAAVATALGVVLRLDFHRAVAELLGEGDLEIE
jgi:hypothetical protein